MWVVQVVDDEQGFEDELIFGPFRSQAKADAFATAVNRRLERLGYHSSERRANVQRLLPPLHRTIRANGFYDPA